MGPLSLLLIHNLHRLVADIVVLLEYSPFVGVDDPHTAVEARLVRFVEGNVGVAVVFTKYHTGDDGRFGTDGLEVFGRSNMW